MKEDSFLGGVTDVNPTGCLAESITVGANRSGRAEEIISRASCKQVEK
jgi:hypothetical protein